MHVTCVSILRSLKKSAKSLCNSIWLACVGWASKYNCSNTLPHRAQAGFQIIRIMYKQIINHHSIFTQDHHRAPVHEQGTKHVAVNEVFAAALRSIPLRLECSCLVALSTLTSPRDLANHNASFHLTYM